MQRLVLAEDLLTGIAAVDEQHRELFTWGNALLFPEGGELSPTDLGNGLTWLEAYVGFHFATEEQAMHQLGYPRADAHRWQHRHFQREIRKLTDLRWESGPSGALSLQLHYLLQDWLGGHIRYSDTDLAAWLRARSETWEVSPVTREAMIQLGLSPDDVRVVGQGLRQG